MYKYEYENYATQEMKSRQREQQLGKKYFDAGRNDYKFQMRVLFYVQANGHANKNKLPSKIWQ